MRERQKPSRQLRDSKSSAAEGRPLGAMIHVLGINRSISASAVFGDFYRCAALLDLGPIQMLNAPTCAGPSFSLKL